MTVCENKEKEKNKAITKNNLIKIIENLFIFYFIKNGMKERFSFIP